MTFGGAPRLNWIAGLVVRRIVDMEEAAEMILDVSYRLAKQAYKLEDETKPSQKA